MELEVNTNKSAVGITEKCSENDRQKIEGILPPEIWEKVYENLVLGRDCISLCSASSYWSDVLESRKARYLFGEVLPILSNYVDSADLLNCRLVCKMWKRDTDAFLGHFCLLDSVTPNQISHSLNLPGNNISYRGFVFVERMKERNSKLLENISKLEGNWLVITNRDRIQQLMRTVGSTTGNLFTTRRLEFFGGGLQPEDAEEGFWTEVISFLKVYGHHLWTVAFIFNPDRFNFFDTLDILKNCLFHLPNLKRLSVRLSNANFPVKSLGEEVISDWKRQVERQPFPQLPRLEQIEIKTGFFRDYELWGSLSTFPNCYYEKLLNLDLTYIGFLKHVNLEHDSFSNLCHLRINLESPEELNILAQLQLPLLKRVKVCVSCSTFTWIDLFRSLETFGKTLKVLELMTSGQQFQDKTEFEKREELSCFSFPELSVIKMDSGGDPLNFLPLIAHSLPAFYIHLHGSRYGFPENPYIERRHDDLVEVHGFVKCLYTSNIWNMFPKLKRFRFSYDWSPEKVINFHYTRDGFNQFRASQVQLL